MIIMVINPFHCVKHPSNRHYNSLKNTQVESSSNIAKIAECFVCVEMIFKSYSFKLIFFLNVRSFAIFGFESAQSYE